MPRHHFFSGFPFCGNWQAIISIVLWQRKIDQPTMTSAYQPAIQAGLPEPRQAHHAFCIVK